MVCGISSLTIAMALTIGLQVVCSSSVYTLTGTVGKWDFLIARCHNPIRGISRRKLDRMGCVWAFGFDWGEVCWYCENIVLIQLLR